MERYNFQINHPRNWKDWEYIPVHIRYFQQREQAVLLAKRAARLFRTEVRLTTGSKPLQASGAYIRG